MKFKIKNLLPILLGKLVLLFSRLFGFGAGSTWPGHIALLLNKNFLKETLQGSNLKVILIAGTNGKTTASTLIRFLLEKKGKKTFQNEEGANLLNGMASALIKNSDLTGQTNKDYAIFETDENTLPLALKQINPFVVIILNLFRDQLDRYGEVNTIAGKWVKALKEISPEVKIILNTDDPQICYLGENLKNEVYYFTLDNKNYQKKEIAHDVDSIFCPRCQTRLTYKGISYSHLGDYFCPKCGFSKKQGISFEAVAKYPLRGLYNIYNINAVLLLINEVLGFSLSETVKDLEKFRPAFGRQEQVTYHGRKFYLLLSKNPAGFNQSIEVVKEMIGHKENKLLVVLNDRIPDGRDISWIWDVEFESLKTSAKDIVVSGDRTYDMALRLKYAELDKVIAVERLDKAIEHLVSVTKQNEEIVCLLTYTGMLEVRKILTGRKLL